MTCPDLDTLEDFALGKLPAARWQLVSDHLQTCEVCAEAIDRVDLSPDPLILNLRTLGRHTPEKSRKSRLLPLILATARKASGAA